MIDRSLPIDSRHKSDKAQNSYFIPQNTNKLSSNVDFVNFLPVGEGKTSGEETMQKGDKGQFIF